MMTRLQISVNTIPGINGNYLWIPETSDNVVPGLDSLLTYTPSKYATLTSLQNSITNINNTINTEMQTLQTETNNIENTPGTGNASNKLQYHTSHTDFRYQRNTTNNDNRRQFVTQRHYFTFQRQYITNHLDLQIQMMQLQMDQMQAQINSMSSNNPPPDEPGIGTAWGLISLKKEYNYYIYEYVGTDICMYHLITPIPRCIFHSHIPDKKT